MISDHFIVLIIVIPLLSAPLCVLFHRPALAWSVALAVTWTTLGVAISLFMRVLNSGVIVYSIGDWAAPWGIEYRLDLLGAVMLLIVSAMGALSVLYARKSVEREIPADRIYLFYAMMLLCQTGLMGISVTGDAFNLFVFLEISSLSSYVLIAFGKDRRALTASLRYLIMGTIGATFYIIGVGMMYMMTGSLNMVDLSGILPAVADTRTILVALAFLTVGLSLKLALFPLHTWLPNAYSYAPSVVSTFIASTATKIAVYALLRIYFTVFAKVDLFHVFPMLWEMLMGLALLGMFAASLVAIFQTNVKRMLAYSSIAQVGYMVLGISFVSVAGLSGTIVHLFNHALTKGALFMAVGIFALRIRSSDLNDLAGIGRRMPVTMAAFVIAGLSLIGVPATAGFVSKWALIQAALEQHMWPIAVLILLSSLLAVIYVWRVVEVAYFRRAPADAPHLEEAPLSMMAPLWVLTAATVYFGINGTATLDVAVRAASILLKGPQ
ncbi:monovalent cation/H+ antiporter subunit D family protein [Varunaivibrio sulfuroxidans]|uniref:Multisubunit sodium/proton antiporter MrpD subunit n=1 Tax=Varunaivibrio sulfuroxidans TaxID=1773489 RepID=A0A4R3JH16_9PROT|nr:monovalent cation/H+ antiporter subunit D family protein [Varunaivibrio sulfuroxidans]TCS64070.1 multisubunit sodium/proton antiporter MrpD subunit [Varunaivibrio sulfuroxidans]WES31479.1 monovalent cation/H+ antiporter subunit D family protein [Varunaivibrio sulfuroxidans]